MSDALPPEDAHLLALDEGWHERYYAETEVEQQVLSLLWVCEEWAWLLRQPGRQRDDDVSLDGLHSPWSAHLALRALADKLWRAESDWLPSPLPAVHGLPALDLAELAEWLGEVMDELANEREPEDEEGTGAGFPKGLQRAARAVFTRICRDPDLTINQLVERIASRQDLPDSESTIKRCIRDLINAELLVPNDPGSTPRAGRRLTSHGQSVWEAMRGA